MNAKLAELNAKVANPRIKVAGAARAEADILLLEHELDKLNGKSASAEGDLSKLDTTAKDMFDKLDDRANSSGKNGLLGKILFGADGSGGIGGGPAGLGSDAESGGGSILSTIFGPLGLAIVPAIGAALVEVTGLVSGIAAAGAGAGSFALLAEPAVKKVETAYTNLNTAQTAYQTAQAKYAADPTKTNATAAASALDSLKAQQKLLSEMSPSEQGAIKGVQGLVSEFGKLSKAFEPEAFKVFNAGLKLANDLLPSVTPFAKTFADAVSKLLTEAGKFTQSKGFQEFLKQFHGLEGPALTAIGDGIGKVVIAFGKLITTMSGKDVAQTIGIAFSVLSGTIDGLRHVVEAIMRAWDNTSKTIARDAREVATAFDALRTDIANWGHDLASYFSESAANIARWAQDVQRDADNVVKWFQQLPGRILSALGSLGTMMYNARRNAISRLLDGIRSMIGEVGSVVGGIASKVAGFFGLSPAKEGPLSGGGAPEIRGQHFAADLARGMTSGLGGVASAARQIAGAAGGVQGGGYGTAAAGGGGDIVFRLGSGGSGLDQMFMTWLKNSVRSGGGDPAIFTRTVKFL